MLSRVTGQDGSRGMPVIGRGDDHRVDCRIVVEFAHVIRQFRPMTIASLGSCLQPLLVCISNPADANILL